MSKKYLKPTAIALTIALFLPAAGHGIEIWRRINRPQPAIQNQDETEDESITVYSDSKNRATADAEALRKCQNTAKARSDRTTTVICLGCTRMTQSGRYSCTLRIGG